MWLLASVAVGSLAACSEETSGSGSEENAAYGVPQRTRFVGQAIDATTRAPVEATFTLCGLGSARTDGHGRFALEIDADLSTLLPALLVKDDAEGSLLALFGRVEAKGYAAQEGYVPLYRYDDPADAALTVADLGVVEMRKGRELQVLVSSAGTPVPHARVYAFALALMGDRSSAQVNALPGSACRTENRAAADASGAARLNGLDPWTVYEIVVPSQDLDGDGATDLGTGYTLHRIEEGGAVVALDVRAPEGGPHGDVVGDDLARFPDGSSFDLRSGPIGDSTSAFGISDLDDSRRIWECKDESVSFYRAITSVDGSVTLVFDAPVSVALAGNAAPRFAAIGNLVAPPASSAGFTGFPLATVPATATSGAQDTIWTFTPQGPLAAGEVYDLQFFAGTEPRSAEGLYRAAPGTALAAPTIDNYNGTTGVGGPPRPLYLDFGEAVTGSYRVLGYTTPGGETVLADPYSVAFYDDSMVYSAAVAPALAGGQLGATPGFRYRVRLASNVPPMPDDVFGYPSRVTLVVTATNASGQTLSEVLTLPVR